MRLRMSQVAYYENKCKFVLTLPAPKFSRYVNWLLSTSIAMLDSQEGPSTFSLSEPVS